MAAEERYTVDEIERLLNELGIDTEVETYTHDDDDDEEVNFRIRCDLGEMSFTCVLGGTAPLFDELFFLDLRTVSENPYRFLDRFNIGRRFSVPRVLREDDGSLVIDEDGDFMVAITMVLPFDGGVTPEHLQYMTNMWVEDLIDFYGIDNADDDEDELLDISLIKPGTPVERIESCLSVLGPQTARQLSRNLDYEKHDVNSLLYKNPDRFEKTADQPPLWDVTK